MAAGALQRRWKVTRERVLAMRAIWANTEAEFHGEFVDFGPIWCWPKPVLQKGSMMEAPVKYAKRRRHSYRIPGLWRRATRHGADSGDTFARVPYELNALSGERLEKIVEADVLNALDTNELAVQRAIGKEEQAKVNHVLCQVEEVIGNNN